MRLISISAIAIASLAAAGCAGTHPVHYYTLQAAPAAMSSTKADGPVIVVGAIATPEALQDGRIRYRIGPNEISAYEYHRWVERPGVMVRESLRHALAATGHYQRVLDAGSGVSGDYLVRGKLTEFGEVDDASGKGAIQTKIALRLELIERKTNRTIWEGNADRADPAAGKSMKDVVQSMERNLQEAMSGAATEIDRFLASRHTS